MKTYKTYQECKISNPECEVYHLKDKGLFACCTHHKSEVVRFVGLDSDGFKCNPSDYCMTVEEFLKAGHKFEAGDLWIDYDGDFMTVGKLGVNHMNKPHERDFERYILRAAALGKPKRTKVEFVKVVGENFFGLESDLLAGNLYCGEGEEWKIIDIPSLADEWANNNLYRRIETEIDERQEFVDAACSVIEDYHGERRQYVVEALYDSGKFKLVN